MFLQMRSAVGYLSIFVPFAFLVVGILVNAPWLAFGCFFVLLPILGFIFGTRKDTPHVWNECIATVLDWLPIAFCAYFAASLGLALWLINRLTLESSDWLGVGLSLWCVLLLGSASAHELLHRKCPRSRFIGNVLAGMMGYPTLGIEHRVHHINRGAQVTPETPEISESVWGFTIRRMLYNFRLQTQTESYRIERGLLVASVSSLSTWLLFVIAAGTPGFILYGLLSVGVSWGIQAMTYIQHWGLGPESTDGHAVTPAWEHGCKIQQWLTLGISFHQTHHLQPNVPYYRLSQAPGAPQLPAGYVFMLMCSIVPSLWRRVMIPQLNRWKTSSQKDTIGESGRQGCVSLSR